SRIMRDRRPARYTGPWTWPGPSLSARSPTPTESKGLAEKAFAPQYVHLSTGGRGWRIARYTFNRQASREYAWGLSLSGSCLVMMVNRLGHYLLAPLTVEGWLKPRPGPVAEQNPRL